MRSQDKLDQLFSLQTALQLHFGHNFHTMDLPKLIEYIRWNILALEDELHEALGETYWKPWADMPPGFKDKNRYIGEIADVMHHLINLCLAAGMSSDDLMAAFEKKNRRNHERIEEGYTGTNKCDGPDCGRALDEPGMPVTVLHTWPTGERFCSPECEERRRQDDERGGGTG
jgi:NTP pyrophosphatase (non-canonical NTP hydrolase)